MAEIAEDQAHKDSNAFVLSNAAFTNYRNSMAEVGVGESREHESEDRASSMAKVSRVLNKTQQEIEQMLQMQNLDNAGQQMLIEKLIEQGNLNLMKIQSDYMNHNKSGEAGRKVFKKETHFKKRYSVQSPKRVEKMKTEYS